MKKNWPVAAFVAACVLLLLGCAQTASAGNIASDVSGAYRGPDRACVAVLRTVPSNVGAKQATITCVLFNQAAPELNGWVTDASPLASLDPNKSTVLWAPGDCWTQVPIWLNPSTGLPPEYLSLRSYTASTLTVVRGENRDLVSVGIGSTEVWERIGNAPSPAPFSCPLPYWFTRLPW